MARPKKNGYRAADPTAEKAIGRVFREQERRQKKWQMEQQKAEYCKQPQQGEK